MSGFCGFIGQSDNAVFLNMINCIKHESVYAPICFDDGYIQFAYVPYLASEMERIGHNQSFTVWVMIEAGYDSDELLVQNIIDEYEKKGIAFAEELKGTFSIVLWDGEKKRLYLLRDRYGSKPLYYAKSKSGIVFGTEIRAILQHGDVKKTINYAAVYQYLSYQSVFLPDTAYEEILHISAGSYGTYAHGKFEEIRYAMLPFGVHTEDSYEEAAEKIEVLLKESVRKCTRYNDMGVFLSGGLDSAFVTALAREGRITKAFCLKPITKAGSIHRKEEDVKFSAQLAKEYGMEHYVWEMTPEELIAESERIIDAFGQPFAGTMSTYFLAKRVSKHCKSIVTGDGADELFGSYRHQSVLLPLQRYVGYRVRGEKAELHRKELYPYDMQIPLLENLYQYAGDNDTLWYYRLLLMGDGEKSVFLNPERFERYIDEQYTLKELISWDRQLKSDGVLKRALERDFLHLMPGHTMLYQDTLARVFGVGLSMPFMDKNLTDYVATLPQDYMINEGVTKAVLRESAKGVLSRNIIERRKEPFSLPIVEWLKEDLREYLTDILSEESVKRHGLLNPICVQYALSEFYKHPNSKEYYGQMLWTMAMLEKWADGVM